MLVANSKERGFSLFELIVVMALSASLFSMALINAKGLANQSLNGASSLMGFLKVTRAKALATTQAYTIAPISSTQIGTTYGDTCSDTTQTADSEVFLELPSGAFLSDTTWSLCYNTRGFSDNSLDIQILDHTSSRTVQVVLGGGVRVQ